MLEMIVENEEQELERDGAACREVMERRKKSTDGDLISRRALIDVLQKHKRELVVVRDMILADGERDRIIEGEVLGLIKAIVKTRVQPAADAVPVARGWWELHGNDDDCGCSHFCSNCYEAFDEDWFYVDGKHRHLNFCPNCGAKMDGDVNGR